MAERKQIDWEAIEKQYRMGQKTMRALADEFGVNVSNISRRAKKYEWVQDKSEEVRQRTNATLVAQQGRNTPTPEDVEVAVRTNVEVVRQHRKLIGRTIAFANRLLDNYEGEKKLDPKVDNRVFLSIAQGIAKVIPLERQAFSLDSSPDQIISDLIGRMTPESKQMISEALKTYE